MTTVLRRLFWLALLGGAGFAARSLVQRKNQGQPGTVPEWPPLDTTSTSPQTATFADVGAGDRSGASVEAGATTDSPSDSPDSARSAEPAGSGVRWVEPTDGACPIGHPIKANDNSGIFHVPGGRFYDRTGAERCYARAEDAEADGYRAAKS